MNDIITTRQISAKTRVYYVDAHRDGKGEPYIVLSEIPTDAKPGQKKRQRVFVHSSNVHKLIKALREVADELGTISGEGNVDKR